MSMNEGGRRGLRESAATFSFLLIAAGVILLLLSSSAREGCNRSQGFPPENHSPPPLLLVILDFNSFSCLTCLDSFLDFHRRLSGTEDERLLWGILVFDAGREKQSGPRFIQILEKKLNGFVQGNRLRFPIIIDRDHLFSSLAEEGSAVLVFDPNQRMMRKFAFPLRSHQIQDILRLVEE